MRTNIVIDDQLMEEALKLSKLKTKRAVVEEGLKLLIRDKQRESKQQQWLGSLRNSGRITGDVVSPATDASEWEALDR